MLSCLEVKAWLACRKPRLCSPGHGDKGPPCRVQVFYHCGSTKKSCNAKASGCSCLFAKGRCQHPLSLHGARSPTRWGDAWFPNPTGAGAAQTGAGRDCRNAGTGRTFGSTRDSSRFVVSGSKSCIKHLSPFLDLALPVDRIDLPVTAKGILAGSFIGPIV